MATNTILATSTLALSTIATISSTLIETVKSTSAAIISTSIGIITDIPTTCITLLISAFASVIAASIFEGIALIIEEASKENKSSPSDNDIRIILEEAPGMITNSAMKLGGMDGIYNSKGGSLGLSHHAGYLDEADKWWEYPY